MLTILTAGKTTAERAAGRCGIPCSVRRTRRSGSNRRSYHQCRRENATTADGTLILGDTVPPFNAEVRLVLEANKPASAVAVRVALRFPDGVASTRRWLHKNRIKTLHVTGTAPRSVAVTFLMAVLKPQF